jgi:hypothetical protein
MGRTRRAKSLYNKGMKREEVPLKNHPLSFEG